MIYHKNIKLKNGLDCCLRNGEKEDGEEVLSVFNQTHSETDYLRTYPDENNSTVKQEQEFLEQKKESASEIEVIAQVAGKIVGSAGIEAIGSKYKERHRAEFGISILKEYWGLGIGSALTEACIECAKMAGYTQLELCVVAENTNAVTLYKKKGFVEYGRNPREFRSRTSGYQEVVHMLLAL